MDFFRSKESKPKNLKLVLSYDNAAEPARKKDRKDKKKRFWGYKREYIREQKE